jgi:clan AA aspartic protease (TIGR02281 family)
LRLSATLLLAAPLLALWPTPASAAIYTWTDAGGSVHYSDTPVHGSAEVDIGHGNTVANPHYNQASLRKQIPYRDIGGQIHVDGRVNGVPVDFIVDTGASLVVIPRAVAAQAGIDTKGMARLQTANGIMDAPVASIRRLSIGALHADHVRAVVHDVDAAGRTGLLGMNVLGAYRMTVDHARSLLLLEPK